MSQGIETIQITSLKIKIGDVSVDVTIDEARKLKGSLDEIFPAQVAPVQIHYLNEPFYVPSQPYYPGWTFNGETTLGDTGGNTCSAELHIEPEGKIIV